MPHILDVSLAKRNDRVYIVGFYMQLVNVK